VIGDEPQLAYNRVLVSSVLAGETAPEDIELKPMSWWRDSPSQAQGAASLEFLPTFSAPHRRGDRIGWLLPVLMLWTAPPPARECPDILGNGDAGDPYLGLSRRLRLASSLPRTSACARRLQKSPRAPAPLKNILARSLVTQHCRPCGLLFPVRPHVDLVASAAALGADDARAEPRNLGVRRIT
jgi:hypothetical protein